MLMLILMLLIALLLRLPGPDVIATVAGRLLVLLSYVNEAGVARICTLRLRLFI